MSEARSDNPAREPGVGDAPTPAAAQSLSAWLRARDDAFLTALLAARPDLAAPVPADLTVLAARAGVRVSVLRALDSLDAAALAVLDVLVLADGPLPAVTVAERLGAALPPVLDQLDRLRGLALVWGGSAELDPREPLHLLRTVREIVERPAGLGRPGVDCLRGYSPAMLAVLLEATGQPTTPDRESALTLLGRRYADTAALTEEIAGLAPPERGLLDRLADVGPLGSTTTAPAVRPPAAAATPLERLLATGLLTVVDPVTVELPREVGIAARGGRPLGAPALVAPPLRGEPVDIADADAAGAAQAAATVRLVEELLTAWGDAPPAVLRSGGLGVRELRALARRLELPEPDTGVLLEVAYSARLLDATPGLNGQWAPTPLADTWGEDELASRWALLGEAWLAMTRVPVLIGVKDLRDRALPALSPELERVGAREARREVLDLLATTGVRPDPASLAARLAWAAPRRATSLSTLLREAALREADLLGVTGRGRLTTAGRMLLTDGRAAAAAAVRPALPAPVRELLLQADLTAVAAGPLEPGLAARLRETADIESAGGATVYRFSEASVRRALDLGRTGGELLELLRGLARSGVPQTLEYLITDLARRHGTLRAGTATAYLRCEDEALLTEALATRAVAALGVRRLAPTVAVTGAAVSRLLEVLRGAGYAPAAEGPDGALVLGGPEPVRAPVGTRVLRGSPPGLSDAQRAAVVRELREGDRAALVRRTSGSAALAAVRDRSPVTTLALLEGAIRDASRVWLGYLDATGQTSQRIVAPRRLEGGYLDAYDERAAMVKTFAVHRVTGVVPVSG